MMERAPTAVMIAMAVKEPARGVRRVVQYTPEFNTPASKFHHLFADAAIWRSRG